MRIRTATEADIYTMADMALQGEMAHLHDLKDFTSEAWIEEWIDILRHGEGGMVVADLHGKLLGALAWTYIPNQYVAGQTIMDEAFWWVVKDKMTSRVGTRLLEEYLLIADDLGLDAHMTLGDHTPPGALWLLERYGFKPSGLILRKEYHDGQSSKES